MNSAAETDEGEGSAHGQLDSDRPPRSAERSAAGAAGTQSEAVASGGRSQVEQDMYEAFERLPDLGGAAATDGHAAIGPWAVAEANYDPR